MYYNTSINQQRIKSKATSIIGTLGLGNKYYTPRVNWYFRCVNYPLSETIKIYDPLICVYQRNAEFQSVFLHNLRWNNLVVPSLN